MPTHSSKSTRVHRSQPALLYPPMPHEKWIFFKQKKNCRRHLRNSAARERRNWRWTVHLHSSISGYGIFISRPTKPVDGIGNESFCKSSWVQKTNHLDREFIAWIALFDLSETGISWKSLRKRRVRWHFADSGRFSFSFRLSSLFIADKIWGIFLSSGEACFTQTQVSYQNSKNIFAFSSDWCNFEKKAEIDYF